MCASIICVKSFLVLPSAYEPLSGWVDNLNGPTGVMIGAAKGVIRSMICEGSFDSEVIPVDYAINGLIVIAKEVALMKEKPKQIPVYNITCEQSKKRTWKWIMDTGRRLGLEYPFNVGLWYPDGNMTTSRFYHWICVTFFMWLPAYFIDFLLLIAGQKRFMIRVQTKIKVGLEVLQFFTTRQWDFKSNYYALLWDNLIPKDKEIFNMNMKQIDDEVYMKNIILGGKQYICKEPLSTIPRAKLHVNIFYVVDRLCKILIVGYFFYWLLLKLSNIFL